MSAMSTIPAGPWTAEDLDGWSEGSTTRYELVDGAYREVARGSDVTVEQPFPVRTRLCR